MIKSMNTTLKSLMLIVMALSFLASCNEQKKELKKQVEKFNNECPIPLGDIGSLNSMSYNDEFVEIKFTSNETFAPISSLSNHPQEVKEMLAMGLTKNSSRKLIDLIISANTSFKTVFVGSQTGQRAEFNFTTNELSGVIERFSNMNDKQKLIVTMLMGSKIKLPLVIDNMTKLVGLSLTKDALIYKYEINDTETGQDMDSFVSFMKYITLSQMAHTITNNMMGERNREFYQALVDCHQGMKYEYHELNTGKNVTFNITTNEIKDVLNGKYQDSPTPSDWDNLTNALDELDDLYEDEAVVDTVW